MKGLKCSFSVSGENIGYLLQSLKDKNISVYNFRYNKNKVKITIENKDCKKFFAICSRMCYNIERTGYKGKVAPLKYLADRAGLAIGAVAFIFFSAFSDGIILGVRYEGDASEIAPTVENILKEEECFTGNTFSAEKGERVSSSVLRSSERVTFASVRREGHFLYVNVYLAEEKPVPLDSKRENILSPVDGIIGKIIVFSGISLVSEGDEVKAGDLLISGSYVHGEKTGTTYALGEIVIFSEREYVYEGAGDDDKIASRAKALAEYDFGEDFLAESITFEERDGKRVCVVKGKTATCVG